MKHIVLTSLLLLTFLASCGPATDADVVPTDLEGKKVYLKTKKAELRTLTQQVEHARKGHLR